MSTAGFAMRSAAALDCALGHYRAALEAHSADDYARHLLVQRLGLLETWRAGRP